MKSVMAHNFSTVPTIDAPRSQFDRSFGYKTAFDAGYLIPFFIDDVIPGDTFNLRTTGFARMATPLFPVMDNAYLDTHFFFVPDRLVWDNARKFYGEQDNPADSIDFQIPTVTVTPTTGSIWDYMGLPIGTAMTVNALYSRGINLIYNEWFRDQNLQDSLVVDTDDGPDTAGDYTLFKRGKRHDYFTSALPWPQKGDAVSLPLGSNAPVVGTGADIWNYNANVSTPGNLQVATTTGNVASTVASTGAPSNMRWGTAVGTDTVGLEADLTAATAATINDLREAFQVQKLLERDARGGTRYSELVKNHFGVNFYDVSYRPEFLGGGSTPINQTPVAATGVFPASQITPGDLGAYATASFTDHGFSKSFVEHGFVVGFVSVRADLTYQQGIPRHFLKSTRYDRYWPSLAHLGEQEITNAEIYYTGTTTDDDIFGYQERYAEYRYKPSQITGLFRSTASGSLDAWHLSQEFGSLPILGDTFIQEDPPFDRVIAVASEPHFIFDSYTSFKCARPMPVYGTPGLIDHF